MSNRIVVLGSGYAGTRAVQYLQKHCTDKTDVVWISRTPYHYVLHESHKVIREPKYNRELTIPTADIVDDARFIQAVVNGVNPEENEVRLEDGRRVAYTHLISALGSQTATHGVDGVDEYGFTLNSRSDATSLRKELVSENLRDEIAGRNENCLRVVIGGAGLTGVQIAGEIAEMRRSMSCDVEVVLLDRSETFLPDRPKLRTRIRELLSEKRVTLRSGMPVTEVTDDVAETPSLSIPYDVFVWAAGQGGPDGVDEMRGETGFIPTNKTLQTEYENVFAAGDSVELVESSMGSFARSAQSARQTGRVAAENVLSQIRGEQLSEFEYTNRGTLVTVGDDVVAQVPFTPVEVFSGRPAQLLKKGITEAWIESLTSPVDYYELVPSPNSANRNSLSDVAGMATRQIESTFGVNTPDIEEFVETIESEIQTIDEQTDDESDDETTED